MTNVIDEVTAVMQAAPPPEIVQVAPVQAVADFVIVSRDSRNELVATADRPMPLIKAGRTEDALLRHAVFVTSTTTIVRPTAQPAPDVLRWTHEAFLQRQLCFTSMTGQFSCTAAEVVSLPDKISGEAPAPPVAPPGPQAPASEPRAGPPPPSPADAARLELVEALKAKAATLFDDDRRSKVDPMLQAAGVAIRRPTAPAARSRP